MLYLLYSLTKDWQRFHELCRRSVILLELPVFKAIFWIMGASKVTARHSIISPGFFNIFMSDVDLSVRAKENDFRRIFDVSLLTKKFFLNLGEIEFYNDEEWNELMALTGSVHDKTWERILLIRKLTWQKKTLNLARTKYEIAKHERGIVKTLDRLGLSSQDDFCLDSVFPEYLGKKSSGGSPIKSSFLEQELSFKDKATAVYFWKLLPDSEEHPDGQSERELKSHLIRREILLTVVSKRNQSLRGQLDNPDTKEDWITKLKTRQRELRN